MSEILVVLLIVLAAWFVLKIARVAMKVVGLFILIALIAIAYFVFYR